MAPCPFCGSDVRLNKWSKRIGKACPHILRTAQVKCKRKSCGMSGPLFKGEASAEVALKHWGDCRFDQSMRVKQ